MICPVVINDIVEMNKNANGRDAVVPSTGASAMNITPTRRPNIKKLIIIREFKIR